MWLIILTFAICWLPQNIRFALKAIYYPSPIFWEKYDNEFFFAMQIAIQLLAYANRLNSKIILLFFYKLTQSSQDFLMVSKLKFPSLLKAQKYPQMSLIRIFNS